MPIPTLPMRPWSTLARTATLLVLAASSPCGRPAAEAELERRLGAMGTWLDVAVAAPDRQRALKASEAAVRAVEAVERRLSTWRDDSELARLNAAPVGRAVAVSAALFADLERAQAVWRATDGAFDPAVGALVGAWDLRGEGRVPADAELALARVPGGFGALRLERVDGEPRATRTHAALRIEEGGFGKGIGLDAARAELERSGATRARVDLGGQVLAFGAPVRVRLADPDQRARAVLDVELAAGSLATSGNSERAIEVDGVRYGHLLDPRSGWPAADFGSLSVVADDATTADALSTGLYAMGPERALAWASEHAGVEVIVLERAAGGLRARATAGLEGRVRALADDLALELLPPVAARAAAHPGRPSDR